MKDPNILRIAFIFALIALLAAPCYAAYETSLVGYWKFDETAGSTAYDSTANDHDGTINGDTTLGVSGKYGTAFSFDGNGDYVGTAAGTMPYATTQSFGGWVKLNDLNNVYVMMMGALNSAGGDTYARSMICLKHTVLCGGDKWFAGLGGGSNFPCSNDNYSNLLDGQWHHLMVTHTATHAKFYRDGNDVSGWVSLACTPGTSHYGETWGIGTAPNYGGANVAVNGSIDEVAFWNRTLDSNEVGAIFAGGVETFEHITTGINDTLGLGYTTAQINQLVELYVNSGDPVDINGTTWYYTTNELFGHDIGDVWQSGGYYTIKLGSGITTAPEPASALFALAGLGFAIKRKRRRS